MTYGGICLADSYVSDFIGIIDLAAAAKIFGNHNQSCIGKLLDSFADRADCNSASRCDGLLAGVASILCVSTFAKIAIHIKSNRRQFAIKYLILYDKKVSSFHLGEHSFPRGEGIKMPLTTIKEKVRGMDGLIFV